MYHKHRLAFTVVELMLVVAVVSTIVIIGGVSYGAWQRKTSSSAVQSDLHQAMSGLANYKNFKNNYPPNLAGTGFAASARVVLKLSTNAPTVGVYENLNTDQNAQLFLNACNANMFATPNNTACVFQGNGAGAKIHVKGTAGSNAIWNNPITQSGLSISCGAQQSQCDGALASLISQFSAQGGEFPVSVAGTNVPLPEPTLVPNGPANRYCLEGRSTTFTDIIYHSSNDATSVEVGACPNDPTLHYFQ